MVLTAMCPQRAPMVDSAWAWSVTVKGSVCGLKGLVRHGQVTFMWACEPGPPRSDDLFVGLVGLIRQPKGLTLGPLGASRVARREMVDVNLHRSSIFFFPSRRFSILILCRMARRNKISRGNYITGGALSRVVTDLHLQVHRQVRAIPRNHYILIYIIKHGHI